MRNYISPLDISFYLKRSFKRFFIGLPIVLIISYCLLSCGAKKVNKSESEKEVKTEKKEVVKNDIVTDTNVKTEIKTFVIDSTKEEIEEVEVTPIDNSKPSIYEGKEISNSKVVKRKIKRNKALKSENNINAQLNEKTTDKTNKTTLQQEQTKESVKAKNIDRKQFDPLSFFISYWWLWIIILIIVWLCRKKLFNLPI